MRNHKKAKDTIISSEEDAVEDGISFADDELNSAEEIMDIVDSTTGCSREDAFVELCFSKVKRPGSKLH